MFDSSFDCIHSLLWEQQKRRAQKSKDRCSVSKLTVSGDWPERKHIEWSDWLKCGIGDSEVGRRDISCEVFRPKLSPSPSCSSVPREVTCPPRRCFWGRPLLSLSPHNVTHAWRSDGSMIDSPAKSLHGLSRPLSSLQKCLCWGCWGLSFFFLSPLLPLVHRLVSRPCAPGHLASAIGSYECPDEIALPSSARSHRDSTRLQTSASQRTYD